MPHAPRVALLICLCAPVPAAALVYEFSGVVESKFDPSHVLDPAVTNAVGQIPATAVSGSYTVDITSATGSNPYEVGPAELAFRLGDESSPIYQFAADQSEHAITLFDDTGPLGSELDLWQSRAFTLPNLTPPATPSGGSFAGYAVRVEFFDNTASRFTSATPPLFVPEDLIGWTPGRLFLESLALNGDGTTSPDGLVYLQMDFTSWGAQPVPEPRSAALLALGLASLAHRQRRARGR